MGQTLIDGVFILIVSTQKFVRDNKNIVKINLFLDGWVGGGAPTGRRYNRAP